MENIIKKFEIIKDVILEMGGTIEEFIPERGCLYVNLSGKTILIEQQISITRQSFISERLTMCKDITDKLLNANELPTPTTECFYYKTYDKADSLKQLEKLTYPIILKNATGSNSIGMFPNINNKKEANKVLKKQLPIYRSMLAQQMVFGKEYRILILGDKIIGALEMIHPYIIGDGISSVRKIIKQKQILTEKKTKFNKELAKTLRSQQVNFRTVIPKGKIIYFKNNSSLAEGGETAEVTDTVHKDIKDICVKASKVVGRYLVGIDVICKDISKKPTRNNFNILDINSKPDLYIHYNPTHGNSKNVLKDVIKFLTKISIPTNKHP